MEIDPVLLIQSIACGERQAFESFYDRFAPLAYTLAMRILQNRSAAEDLVQEIFLQVWQRAATYSQDRGDPQTWVIMMTRSRAIDKLRALRKTDKRFVSVDEENIQRILSQQRLDNPAQKSEIKLMLSSALSVLPKAQVIVLELAYFRGLTQAEIAARLAEPLGTVKSRMRAGLDGLRKLLDTKQDGQIPLTTKNSTAPESRPRARPIT